MEHIHNIRMCEIDIGNPKYTTFTKLVQVRNFITFQLKVIQHEERERDNLSMLTTFTSAPNHVRPPSANYWSALGGPRKSTFPFGRRDSTNYFFLKSQKSSAHASGAWRYSHPLVQFPIWGFILTSVNDTSSLRAREHLRSCLHLTNPCTEPKGSQPN